MRTLSFFNAMCLIPELITLIAKLAIANTFHVRASYLFLDRLFAFRALPSIIANPGRVSFLGVDQFKPSGNILTHNWMVRLFSASITVQLAAWTYYCVNLHHIWLYAKVRAFLIGAIADILILNGVVDADLLPI
jgi:hypothetical protein